MTGFKCDNCIEFAAGHTRLPEGWYQVSKMGGDGRFQDHAHTFCHAGCLHEWITGRAKRDAREIHQPPNESTEAPAAGSEHAVG